MLAMYYRLMNKTKTPREVYPLDFANEIWTLCEDNQHIISCNEPGTYENAHLIDFKAFYPTIMSKVLLPCGNVLKTAPKSGKYAKFHLIEQSNGEQVYMWDEMLQFYSNYKILNTWYMKLSKQYQDLGKEILRRRELMPDRKSEFMIFGCLFYGRKQGYKHVENFFAGSYLYVQAFLIMDKLVNEIFNQGCKLLNSATDSILYQGDFKHNFEFEGYKFNIKDFSKVEYKGLNYWRGFNNDNIVVEKHQGDEKYEIN